MSASQKYGKVRGNALNWNKCHLKKHFYGEGYNAILFVNLSSHEKVNFSKLIIGK